MPLKRGCEKYITEIRVGILRMNNINIYIHSRYMHVCCDVIFERTIFLEQKVTEFYSERGFFSDISYRIGIRHPSPAQNNLKF